MNENPPETPESAPAEDPELVAQWRRLFSQFRGLRKPKLPYAGAKFRDDGHDQARLDLAAQKRARKAQRRLNEFHQ